MHWRTYVMVENLNVRFARNTFDTLMAQLLLYVVEAQDRIINSTRKEFENVQTSFLMKFHQIKPQKPYMLILETDHFPMRSWPWKGLLRTCLQFKITFALTSKCMFHTLYYAWWYQTIKPSKHGTTLIDKIASISLNSHSL